MKILKTLLLLLLFVAACDNTNIEIPPNDFNELMGGNKSVGKFNQTYEDSKNLQIFKDIYNKNKDLLLLKHEKVKLPTTIHFIWLGPNPYPTKSIKNIFSWVKHHPNWTFKLWSDHHRPLPHPRMQLHLVSDFTFIYLKELFQESNNYAEKAAILRYEILNQEGGLYVDHDVECYKPFTPFHAHFDFYCGTEPFHQPILSSSVLASTSIIGSCPDHPIIKKVIEKIKAQWIKYAIAYPANDRESVIYRVMYRTVAIFNEVVKEAANHEGKKDIVFPAAYFNKIDNDFAFFAHHHYNPSWFGSETQYECSVQNSLLSIAHTNDRMLLLNAIILSLNLILFTYLFFHWMKKNDSR